MAKRTRASRSAHRPGGQGPSRTKKSSSDGSSQAAPHPDDVIDADEIGLTSAEVKVDEAAAAAVAATAAKPEPEEQPVGRRSRRRTRGRTGKKSRDELAARASAETVWVRQDLRRIGVISVIMVAALAVAYVVFGVIDVLNLY